MHLPNRDAEHGTQSAGVGITDNYLHHRFTVVDRPLKAMPSLSNHQASVGAAATPRRRDRLASAKMLLEPLPLRQINVDDDGLRIQRNAVLVDDFCQQAERQLNAAGLAWEDVFERDLTRGSGP